MRGRNRASTGRRTNQFSTSTSSLDSFTIHSIQPCSPIFESRVKVASDQRIKEDPMATNLGDLVRGYLTPDVLERAASFAGASPAGTEKAVAAAVPAVIGALAEMASNRTGAEQIGRMLDTGK